MLCVRKLRDKTYTGIDQLPIYNWWKLHETGDVTYLLKERTPAGATHTAALSIIWKSVYNEYIKLFGFGEVFMDIINKQKQIALLKVEMIVTGDRSIQTFIDLSNLELEQLRGSIKENSNFYEYKGQLEKFLGFKVDIMQTSVSEFYSYVKLAEKAPRRNG